MMPLEAIIDPYLDIDGIESAALVSRDGLLITSVGDSVLDLEAVAAYAATTLSAADELWAQLESGNRRYIAIDLADSALVVAVITDDILLLLNGRKQAIRSLVRMPVPA